MLLDFPPRFGEWETRHSKVTPHLLAVYSSYLAFSFFPREISCLPRLRELRHIYGLCGWLKHLPRNSGIPTPCRHLILGILTALVLGLGYVRQEAAAPPEGFHHEDTRSLAAMAS